MLGILERLVGPRVPVEDLRAHKLRFAAPTVLLMAARLMLLDSIFLPYWPMELDARQYPNALVLTA